MFQSQSPILTRRMIELCTFKRMIGFVITLIAVCACVVLIENYLTPQRRSHSHPYPTTSATSENYSTPNCWEKEQFFIKENCQPCSEFERRSGHIAACGETGFKEIISCHESGEVWRVCHSVPWLEERKFWIFEGCMIGLGLLSAVSVVAQRRYLDRKTLARIQKQIAAGV